MDNASNANPHQRVDILVTIDKKYIQPLLTMLASYGEHHAGVPTTVHIAHSALEQEHIARIEKLAAPLGIEINSVHITENWFSGTPVLERLPQESFFRLMAFHYLPKDMHRCLYLDPDIFIRKSVLPLYDLDIGENYIAAASHMRGFVNRMNKARLGIDEPKRYINSGIMLMNLDAIRKDFTIESILESLNENLQKLLMGDQDLINILFGEKTVLIDECIYNLDERTYKRFRKKLTDEKIKSETAIIHYDGKYKPWLYGYQGYLDRFYPEVKEKGPAPKGEKKAQVKAVVNIMRSNKQQNIIIGGCLVMLLLCVFSYVFFGKELLPIIANPDKFRAWLNNFGVFDEVVFILLRTALTLVKFLPAEPIEIASGYAWGAVPAAIYCLIGNIIGSIIILTLTKRFGRKFVDKFLNTKKWKIIKLLENSRKVYVLLFFIYLIPGSPKDGLTYIVGLLPIKSVPFLIITSVARIPSIISSTICGATLAEEQYLVSAIIFATTVVFALLGALIYKKYSEKKAE